MGIFVEITKSEKEDKKFAYYNYQFSCLDEKTKKLEPLLGKLKIDKHSGTVYTIEHPEEDTGVYARCASWALMRHWKKGEYPDKTYWES